MSRYGRDPKQIARDLVIDRWRPRSRDTDTLETLRELKAARRGR